ncbi:uncharacterized [Tachysurus ichikawai]
MRRRQELLDPPDHGTGSDRQYQHRYRRQYQCRYRRQYQCQYQHRVMDLDMSLVFLHLNVL